MEAALAAQTAANASYASTLGLYNTNAAALVTAEAAQLLILRLLLKLLLQPQLYLLLILMLV